jgi:arabinose-5-phosphate isomerase
MEIEGVKSLFSILNENIQEISEVIAKCQGKVILSGVGKSGHISKKISSTMSSIGIPSFFLHPSEASHGDLGMISKEDIIILISNSGETREFSHLLSFIEVEKITSICITRSQFSTLANAVKYKIIMPASPEVVSYNAPTTSTTQTLAIGDVLAVCASKIKGFGERGYAKIHPGGKLGLSLTRISSIMRRDFPRLPANSPFIEALHKMNTGFLYIENNTIITDGDIRRIIISNNGNINGILIGDVGIKNPISLLENEAVIKVVELFNEKKIGTILVKNDTGEVVGVVDRKDVEF